MFRNRFLNSDKVFQNIITKKRTEEIDISQTIGFIWAVGVIPTGLVSSGYGVWKGITENKHSDLLKTTTKATGLGLICGMVGVVAWTTCPITLPILGLSYLHKKMN